jgi:hypothetical protein
LPSGAWYFTRSGQRVSACRAKLAPSTTWASASMICGMAFS